MERHQACCDQQCIRCAHQGCHELATVLRVWLTHLQLAIADILIPFRYKYTVQTEGTSYSGRLKYLQLCNSALITHPLQWQEFHTHLLKISGPDMNYIETTENFGNLADAMEYYRVHDDEAEEIAKNSYNTFARRYLTPAAVC